MLFAFSLFNHNELGKKSLLDNVTILVHQLRALGHDAVWSDDKCISGPGNYNVIFEGFPPSVTQAIAERHQQGARFIYIATEEPTDKGFNHGISPEMVERQNLFPEAAKYAEAVFALVPGTEKWYGQFAPSAHLELGYAPSLERKPVQRVGNRWTVIEPEYRCGFFGSLSPRRLKVLKKLGGWPNNASANGVIVVHTFAEQVERDRKMAHARVIVQIRTNEAMGLVSSSRCNTALHIGRPVVAEPHQLSHPWDQVVHFSATLDQFYKDAMEMQLCWQTLHRKQMAAFKELFSPEAQMGRVLREVGITKRLQARRWYLPG